MRCMLDDDEKGTQILRTLGGEQQMTIITESGFYHAAMKSRDDVDNQGVWPFDYPSSACR